MVAMFMYPEFVMHKIKLSRFSQIVILLERKASGRSTQQTKLTRIWMKLSIEYIY